MNLGTVKFEILVLLLCFTNPIISLAQSQINAPIHAQKRIRR